jgi:hypothetical protein
VHVRPLRRLAATGEPAQRPPHQDNPARKASFLAPDHRPPLAGIKLVRPRPRPRLPARRCGRSSLTPDRATAQTGSDEEKPQQQSHPNPAVGRQVTGSIQHGPLTAGVPMGADTSFARVLHSTFLQVRTMGVQIGFRLRNGNSHRQTGPDLRICAICTGGKWPVKGTGGYVVA